MRETEGLKKNCENKLVGEFCVQKVLAKLDGRELVVEFYTLIWRKCAVRD